MSYAPSSSTLASVGLGVPIATVAAWIAGVCCNVPVPGEVQAAIGALISTGIGYFFAGGRKGDLEGPTDG